MTTWKVIGSDGEIRAANTVEAQEAQLISGGERTVVAMWEKDGLPFAIRAYREDVAPDVIASGKCAVVVLDGHAVGRILPSGWTP